tara:strand:- start:784 stop:1197 length:414 start_codon:yes stop_codon:yes gene_type:complete
MSLYELFDEKKSEEKDGFILEICDGDTNIEFTLARAGGNNKKFALRLQALMKPHKFAIEKGTMKDEAAEAIMCQVIAETLVLDWSGVTDREGNELEYSVAKAKELLLELPALRQMILEEAQNVANFQAVEREEREEK